MKTSIISSDTSVAAVQDGTVMAAGPGESVVIVSATDSDGTMVTGVLSVTVVPASGEVGFSIE